ncbi:MAG: hypothetical protein NXI31_04370 [bacterium]|nr:hypothetical protein [bacterium]
MTKIVTSLLALAASSSVLLAQGGGWMGGPGKGLKFDGGDAYSISINNWIKAQWGFRGGDVNPDVNTFGMRAVRTALDGHAFNKNINFRVLLDATDDGPIATGANGPVKEAFVTWNFMSDDNSSLGLRIGQGKTQFGLEANGLLEGVFFIDRSAAARGFSGLRSTGAWLMGSHMENKLRWSAAAVNGASAGGLGAGYVDAGEEAGNSDNKLSYVLNAEFDPMGDTTGGKRNERFMQGDFRTEDRGLQGTVGVGVALENGNSAGGLDVESTSINLNTAWSVEGFQFLGEYFMRTDDQQTVADEEESMGWSVQGTWIMPKSGDSSIQWGFGARISGVEADVGNNATVNFNSALAGIGAADGDATNVSLIANAFYHGHAAKTQFEYTFQQVSPTGGTDMDNHIVQIAFQLMF